MQAMPAWDVSEQDGGGICLVLPALPSWDLLENEGCPISDVLCTVPAGSARQRHGGGNDVSSLSSWELWAVSWLASR